MSASGVGMLAVGHVEQRSSLERFLEEKVLRHADFVHQRESTGGETYEGRAAESYAWAARQLQQAERAAVRFGWGRADIEETWPAIEPIVQAVRVAVHLRDVDGLDGELPWMPFVWLLDAAKRRAAAREDWSEWVAIELDRVTLTADFGSPFAAVHVADDQLQRMDRDAAELLATGLVRHEARVLAQWTEARLARSLEQWLQECWHCYTWGPEPYLASWRCGFDPGQRELFAIEELVAAWPKLQPWNADWPERQRQWRAFLGSADRGCGAYALKFVEGCRDQEGHVRCAVAQMRLLRLAIAFRLGEPLPELADPFADRPLQIEVHADRAHFRSAATHAVLQRVAYRR